MQEKRRSVDPPRGRTLTGVHFLLTYSCPFECDHCFLHCGPRARGTFTVADLRRAMTQIGETPGITSVYFEGGEPFLFHPLLVAGVSLARERGLTVGIVTNCYWAMGEEDARLWLEPLGELGIADLSVSDDEFHGDGPAGERPAHARAAADSLGIPCGSICIEPPRPAPAGAPKGEPVVGGGDQLRGRAAEELVGDLPRYPAARFDECPHEELVAPRRIHLDPFGHVHLCQGIVIGNVWETPLAELDADYRVESHPIAGPLSQGGPAELARVHGVPLDEEGYVDACHLCYSVRKALRTEFPDALAPPQVYGIESDA